jgi:hypothetical protein
MQINTTTLITFSAAWIVANVSFLVMTGAFPLSTRPDVAHSASHRLLAFGNAVLVLSLAATTIWFGLNRLHWTSLVLSSGLIVLFAPALFNAWPTRWRDGLSGQILILGATAAMISLLIAAGVARLHAS